MHHEIPKIPDSADLLVDLIDESKSGKPSQEVIEDLRGLARELVKDKPKFEDPYLGTDTKAGFYKFIDGREAEVVVDLSPNPGSANILVNIVDHLDKDEGKLNGIRKTYFILDKDVTTSIKAFIQQDEGRAFQEFDSDLDSDETIGMSMDEAEELYNNMSNGRDLGLIMGIHQTSNDELVNLMRLLKTSEELVPQNN